MSDGYVTKNYGDQGGDRQVIGGSLLVVSGGLIDIETGGDLKYNGVSLIDEIAALSGLDSGEIGVLEGVTAGTVLASKVLIVDANKDLAALRNLTLVNLDAGASGTAGTIDIFPATAAKGKASVTCADQTGNTTVTLNIEAMGQATNVGVPDPGAADCDVVLTAGNQTLAEGKDFALGTVTGTKLGTDVTQKFGLWGVTPVVQPAAAAQAALTDNTTGTADGTLVDVGIAFSQADINNNFADLVALINAIRTALVNAGIIKGAA